MINDVKKRQENLLIFLGLVLFLIGLAVGLFVQNMSNPRMGLSAHVEGVMNGMFLVLLGLVWQRVQLSKKWLSAAFWLAAYGTFANLAAVLTAAITGYGKMMPIAGGKEGKGIAEALISFLLVSLALCMLAVCIIVLTGLYRHMRQPSNEVVR